MLNTGDDVNGLGKEIRRAVAKTYGWKNFLPEEIQPLQLSPTELEHLLAVPQRGDEVVYIKRENNYLLKPSTKATRSTAFLLQKILSYLPTLM
jgi:hypothetical protein